MTNPIPTAPPVFDSSLFVSPDVHKRQVKLADGKEHTFYIREQLSGIVRAFLSGQTSEDPEKQAESMARIIAKAICTEDGNPALSLEQARNLKFSVQIALASAISGVHSYQGNVSLPSAAPASGSDTPSP
ncbi:phage tail assembly chaperone family protein, TAC [Xanthomonas prunicola]|uniref:phage tail assembly chaperone family protein, TAC n=1 Tax=Xanthomonas prunicola TaxID=2053930 RepID=UPI002078FB5C|nr:phage tail assembly chaperone family protein, TAC [Xanthomonas prunicola]USJ00854.1 phage tail assembly chaperone family protein, TAC [Xanthomonas prunicola]